MHANTWQRMHLKMHLFCFKPGCAPFSDVSHSPAPFPSCTWQRIIAHARQHLATHAPFCFEPGSAPFLMIPTDMHLRGWCLLDWVWLEWEIVMQKSESDAKYSVSNSGSDCYAYLMAILKWHCTYKCSWTSHSPSMSPGSQKRVDHLHLHFQPTSLPSHSRPGCVSEATEVRSWPKLNSCFLSAAFIACSTWQGATDALN